MLAFNPKDMPKKTRQEKILAQLKRLQQQQSNPLVENTIAQPSFESENVPAKINIKSLESSNSNEQTAQKQTSYDYSHVSKDLRKSLIFAVVSIVFELVLSRVS
jgi:hypothetical protein